MAGQLRRLTHYRNGQFQRWAEKDGLPGDTVRSLYRDRDGTLWIGTYDSGLGRFRDGKFTRYTTRDGLFDSGVFQILEDDYGWFWMSCNRGIYRVRKQELIDFAEGKRKVITSVAYGKSDGMLNVECNGGRWPAGVKGRDGKLWFPTMGGVVMIDPANVKANTQPPPVVIEAMKINNEEVTSELWESALRTPHSTGAGEFLDSIHGAELYQFGKPQIQISPGKPGTGMGRSRHAAHGVLLARAAGQLHVQGHRSQ